jgi:hypothetical protein
MRRLTSIEGWVVCFSRPGNITETPRDRYWGFPPRKTELIVSSKPGESLGQTYLYLSF